MPEPQSKGQFSGWKRVKREGSTWHRKIKMPMIWGKKTSELTCDYDLAWLRAPLGKCIDPSAQEGGSWNCGRDTYYCRASMSTPRTSASLQLNTAARRGRVVRKGLRAPGKSGDNSVFSCTRMVLTGFSMFLVTSLTLAERPGFNITKALQFCIICIVCIEVCKLFMT